MTSATSIDLAREIKDLYTAVTALHRARLVRASQEYILEAEYLVCIECRSVFARFVDLALWSSVTHSDVGALREAFHAARFLVVGKRTSCSIVLRQSDFEEFILPERRQSQGEDHFSIRPRSTLSAA